MAITVHLTTEYVEATPEDLRRRERAIKLLAQLVVKKWNQQQADLKMQAENEQLEAVHVQS